MIFTDSQRNWQCQRRHFNFFLPRAFYVAIPLLIAEIAIWLTGHLFFGVSNA